MERDELLGRIARATAYLAYDDLQPHQRAKAEKRLEDLKQMLREMDEQPTPQTEVNAHEYIALWRSIVKEAKKEDAQ